MPKFTHLHVHSHYSLLDGLPKIPELVGHAKESGYEALALTDHGVLYGAIEFYLECRRAGIKPILGMEAYLNADESAGRDYYHLVLLAKNYEGYKNLIALTTKAHLTGYYYKPRIDKAALKQHAAGLLALSGCRRGEVPRLLLQKNFGAAEAAVKTYQEIFGRDGFFLEIQRNSQDAELKTLNTALLKLSQATSTPLVATADVHYLLPEDSPAQDILICVGTGKTVDDPNRLDMRQADLHLLSQEESEKLFADLPEALANTQRIADAVDLDIPLGKLHFPDFPVPNNEPVETYFEKLCTEGLKTRYQGSPPDEVRGRLKYEIDIILKKGYATYFLVVADFVNWARQRGIIATTRGSAAGSLVAYALGITTMDPIAYKLPFERFLNPDRPSPPDIDMDFADNRRDEVLQYVSDKYGRDRVAQIVTFGTMMARAAVRDVGRALGLPYSKCDRVAKMIPFGRQGFHMSIARALKTTPDLKAAYDKDPETKNLIDLAQKVEGVARHASVHAAGVVIAPTKLTDFTPLQLDTENKNVITQYDMRSIETAGLVKMDFLGIRNLSILGNAVEIVRATRGVEIDLQNIPLDDKKTYALLSSGRTLGVFQLGGSGMTRYLMELQPSNIFDIMAMISLYRPGPMESIPEFIKRKHNRSLISYLDPRMKEILDASYGVVTYQDDVLLLAIELAGYSWEEADKLRKAMGKKIPREMAAQKEKFIEGAISNGLSTEKAVKLWALIEPFAAYGFNKAHAVSYAIVAYQTAYMKANFPVEFMAAVMTAESFDNKKVAAAVAECGAMGITVLPPDVNQSLANFTVIDSGQIRFGLSAVKNLGSDVITEIINERKAGGPFATLTDFIQRIKTRNFNKKSWEALVKSGSLDRFGERNQLLLNTESILEYWRAHRRDEKAGQSSLFAADAGTSELKLYDAEPAAESELLSWEKEFLGLYVSSHPLKNYRERLSQYATPISAVRSEQDASQVTVGGIITRVQTILTKRGEQMCFAEIEDLEGSLELVVFPGVFTEARALLATDQIVVARGRVSDKDGEIKLLVDSIKRIEEAGVLIKEPMNPEGTPPRAGSYGAGQRTKEQIANSLPGRQAGELRTPNSEARILKIRIPPTADPQVFSRLKDIFQKYPGPTQIALVIPDREGTPREIKTDFTVESSEEFKEELKQTLRQSLITNR